MTENVLEIENLTVRLADARVRRPVLRRVSMEVAAGSCVALVGESGSGKSLTLRSALRMLPEGSDWSGDVRVTGKSLRSATERDIRELRRRTVSMIWQDPRDVVNPFHRVGDFLTEIVTRYHGLSQSKAKQKAIELLRASQMPRPEEIFEQYPSALSGGMLQRVVIAGALITDPVLLLCDEPTTALDVTSQAEVIAILKDLQRSRGLSMLFVTHDLELASAVADRTYVMYGGEVMEHRETEELLAAPLHPYTRGLLESSPQVSFDGPRPQALRPIPGVPLGLDDDPPGCLFAGRCDRRLAGLCDVAPIAMHTIGNDGVRCVRAEV
ncbi:ABC transporter ATP-binding protein [Leucobacter sp. CSA1]|uniref:ABC transporter ATP-binding protein n=1 Tax=Leucobacter chromiisoli TaxID=2796471 RepID=A0A934UWM0_9MICO|nr:ABC transporter ATP-binding protein [Leucobacter chromiisoli]MBK0420408.1 ABC transporter ATP-binding protein [Leucobacter chromiisoli]